MSLLYTNEVLATHPNLFFACAYEKNEMFNFTQQNV